MTLDDRSEQLRRILRWEAGEQPGPGPTKITLFPTNICNLECVHCWQRWGEYDKTYKTEVSDERLLRLVDEAAEMEVRDWYFVGGGEPMGRGKLMIEMCRRIRGYGMNGTLHTNGTLFRRGMLEELVAIQWAEVNVSLDGPNTEINDHIRSGGFEKATRAVRNLSQLKHAHNVSSPEIRLVVTVTNLTYDKITAFVELAHELGDDVRVELSGLIVEGEQSAGLELSGEQKAAYPGHVRAALERARRLGVRNNFEQYTKEELTRDGMDMHHDYVHVMSGGLVSSMCYEPWTSLAILPDGRVGPCCAFGDPAALSIKHLSLAEVWHGAYMNGVREGMVTGSPPDYCKRCPSNLYVEKEMRREAFSYSLRQWRELRSRSLPGRVQFFVGRSIASVREMGLAATIRRARRWARVRSGVKPATHEGVSGSAGSTPGRH
jgi:MoaA/NifB/PqqE/SkfB family radical SAM enzyme